MTTTTLFVYGTLMVEEVMSAVLGRGTRTLARRHAVLSDHRRFALRDKSYPAVVPSAGSRVEGLLVEGVTAEDLARLDEFEGEEYRRVRCVVEPVPSRDTRLETFVYVWAKGESDPALHGDWSLEEHFLPIMKEQLSRWTTPTAT